MLIVKSKNKSQGKIKDNIKGQGHITTHLPQFLNE